MHRVTPIAIPAADARHLVDSARRAGAAAGQTPRVGPPASEGSGIGAPPLATPRSPPRWPVGDATLLFSPQSSSVGGPAGVAPSMVVSCPHCGSRFEGSVTSHVLYVSASASPRIEAPMDASLSRPSHQPAPSSPHSPQAVPQEVVALHRRLETQEAELQALRSTVASLVALLSKPAADHPPQGRPASGEANAPYSMPSRGLPDASESDEHEEVADGRRTPDQQTVPDAAITAAARSGPATPFGSGGLRAQQQRPPTPRDGSGVAFRPVVALPSAHSSPREPSASAASVPAGRPSVPPSPLRPSSREAKRATSAVKAAEYYGGDVRPDEDDGQSPQRRQSVLERQAQYITGLREAAVDVDGEGSEGDHPVSDAVAAAHRHQFPAPPALAPAAARGAGPEPAGQGQQGQQGQHGHSGGGTSPLYNSGHTSAPGTPTGPDGWPAAGTRGIGGSGALPTAAGFSLGATQAYVQHVASSRHSTSSRHSSAAGPSGHYFYPPQALHNISMSSGGGTPLRSQQQPAPQLSAAAAAVSTLAHRAPREDHRPLNTSALYYDAHYGAGSSGSGSATGPHPHVSASASHLPDHERQRPAASSSGTAPSSATQSYLRHHQHQKHQWVADESFRSDRSHARPAPRPRPHNASALDVSDSGYCSFESMQYMKKIGLL